MSAAQQPAGCLAGPSKREAEIAKTAQGRVERAGYDLAAIADIMSIMATNNGGDTHIPAELVAFLGGLIGLRARLIVDEGNHSGNWAEAEQWH